MVARRVEKGKGRRKRRNKSTEQRRRVGKLRAARHAGEDTAAVGASLRKQKCLRSRVRLGEDLSLKRPGDGLGGGGLPPAEGGANVVQSVSRRWGIGSGLQERLPRGPSKPRLGKLGLRKQEGMTASGKQAKDKGRQVGHLTVSDRQHISPVTPKR